MKRRVVLLGAGLGLAVACALAAAHADAPDAGAPSAPASAPASASASASAPAPDPNASAAPPSSAYADPPGPTCVEHVPDGATRPRIVETFPAEGVSGYAAPLVLRVTHGKGETVIAESVRMVRQGDAARGLAEAGFALPEPDGGAATTVEIDATGAEAVTTLTIPVVPLAPKAGRNRMELPRLPVTVARANGELVTLCTQPHRIRVEEPIAGERDPKVRPNPAPRPQYEEFVFLERLLVGIAIGLVVAALGFWLGRWWRRRAAKAPPPKVRPVPWLVALAELEAIRQSDMLAKHQNDAYFDRVSDAIRRYLGARYHFDELAAGWSGLETTTDEMKALLRRVQPAIPKFGVISLFLDEADLVKFARVLPADGECVEALRRAEDIVRGTIPSNWSATPAVAGAPPPAKSA